jgi:hypothetical protein
MIIWQGWGILTVLILVAGPALGFGLLGLALGPKPPALAFGLASIAVVLLAGAANWWLGRRLNGAPGRELIDARTGEHVVLKRRHALFWIPMQYWSALSLLAAAFMAFALLTQPNRGDVPAAGTAPKAPPASPAGRRI